MTAYLHPKVRNTNSAYNRQRHGFPKSIELVETSSNLRVSYYVSLLLRVRRPFKASVSPSSFEHRSLQSSLSFRTFSNSASSSFIRSTRLWRHLRAARVLSLRFSTRDESTRVRVSSPWEVEGLEREVETGAVNEEIGEGCEWPSFKR